MFCIDDCRTALRLFKGGGVIGYGLCLKATERYSCIGAILLVITLVFFALPIGLRIEVDDVCQNMSVSSFPQTQESVCFSSNGNVYILTNFGMLKSSRKAKMENLALGVDRVLRERPRELRLLDWLCKL